MPTLSSRILNLEQRPQPQRPHGMTHDELNVHMTGMELRQVQAFVKTMTDDDLTARIEYLQGTTEQHHASTSKEN